MNRPINSGKRVDEVDRDDRFSAESSRSTESTEVESIDRVDRFSVELSRFVRLDRFQGLLAMGLCPSVSVCLSQVGVLLKRLNTGSLKQHHTIVQGLFSDAKDLREIRPRSPPPAGALNAGGVGQNKRLLTNNRLYLENSER